MAHKVRNEKTMEGKLQGDSLAPECRLTKIFFELNLSGDKFYIINIRDDRQPFISLLF
jgi:hypothetical protein